MELVALGLSFVWEGMWMVVRVCVLGVEGCMTGGLVLTS